ncbi:hypothetical protein EV681_3089 [Advenella incenata]|uniref:Uncharacterized protein n=1 Tax=Advenella incenata TaxID=267800 RepID=A0A4Q7VFR2_9BURK|nr:hypothetical protein [Advenella incenata]RZT94668.1 hypothetical protein EV681_3089 [Advenella incenata]
MSVQSLSDYYGVDAAVFDETGALDPILGIDTRLFIDPRLLDTTKAPELSQSAGKMSAHFCDVLTVVEKIKTKGDVFWRTANTQLTFPEVKGLAIGYSGAGVNGRGMGPKIRAQLLETIQDIIAAGNSDPSIFELVGVFEEGIGPDFISDMIATIIMPDLISFTQRVCNETEIPMEQQRLSKVYPRANLPKNPFSNKPIVLIPKDVLRALPVAENMQDVFFIAEQNEALRRELNKHIGESWRERTLSEKKYGLKQSFLNDPQTLADVIEAYLKFDIAPYDFIDDPLGQIRWYQSTKNLPQEHLLPLSLPRSPTAIQVFKVVKAICEQFKDLVEQGQLCKLLYDRDGKAKHESAAQLLFFGMASAYCEANNLDLSPESDAGRGPVDFKISSGFKGKVVVEIKLTSNKSLLRGFQVQLPIYQRSEKSLLGIYLVIDNGGASPERLRIFKEAIAETKGHTPELFWVDGEPRVSASKASEDY